MPEKYLWLLPVLIMEAVVVPTPARAQTLEDAEALYLAASFRESQTAFLAVLAQEDLLPEAALSAHRHLAALFLMFGETDQAQRHAEAAVALAPEITAPEGLGEEALSLFTAARASLGDNGAQLEIEDQRNEVVPRLRVSLSPAPEMLAAELRLTCDSVRGLPIEGSGAVPELIVDLDTRHLEERLQCHATALTESGAALLRSEATLEATLDEIDATEDGTRRLWPWLVGAGTGVAVVLAIVLALTLTRDDEVDLGAPLLSGW